MLDKKIEKALNDQINEELFSSYLYLAMSAWFEDQNWRGFARWMALQSQEEYGHAMKIYHFVLERGGKVELKAIAEPKKEWKSVLNAFEEALAHEEHITKCINDLTDLAIKTKDHATAIFLQWFVTEQVEEEANATEMIGKLQLVKDASGGLFMIDKEAGARAAG